VSQIVNASPVWWGPPGATATDASLVLWGVGTARAFRVHWMLAELGLPYISHRIQSRTGETMTDEYLKLNPRHKIPTLQHGTLCMGESAAIVHYLCERFETAADFYAPADPAARAKINEWCYFVMNELDGHTLYVIRRHVGLKHIYGEAPEAVESAKTYFRAQIEAVEPRFRATGNYLFGDHLSIADILLATCLDWAVGVEIPLPNSVMAYRERTSRRPAYGVARHRNDPTVAPPPEALLSNTAGRKI
jgi:glutathione S-transferase